ncbi:MAG: PqqD family protein [Bacteroidetes bacterium]|nr:MAG: PqqD family protein [Bacteroidota bacterium]
MRIKKNIALSESGFIFHPSTGDSYSVNPIGLEILNLMKAGQSSEEIKAHMLEHYRVDGDSFEKDFYDFQVMLRTYKLVEDHE